MGIWCDFCKYGFFDIEDSVITHNGSSGIRWEMSGGWTSEDHALIKNNVIQGNNWRTRQTFNGGVSVSTANDITVTGNTLGQNVNAAVDVIFTSSRNPPQPDSRGVIIQSNTMNGDVVKGCGLVGVSCAENI